MITIRLAEPIPLLNTWERMHWRARKRYKEGLAWEVRCQAPNRAHYPLSRVTIAVERLSTRTPDEDGLITKGLLDVLQPASRRHPYGLGIIAEDAPSCIVSLDVRAVRCRRGEQCTVVTIEEVV